MNSITIYVPTFDSDSGIGRHALTLKSMFNKRGYDVFFFSFSGSWFENVYTVFVKLRLRPLVDTCFILCATIHDLCFPRRMSIAPSQIGPLTCGQMHFSSCHLHSLLAMHEIWKLFISFTNFFYVLVELLQYKFTPNKVFLSDLQKAQFFKYYGTPRKYVMFNSDVAVLRPVLDSEILRSEKPFPSVRDIENEALKIIFIGYNHRIKGLGIALKAVDLLAKERHVELHVYGSDKKFQRQSSHLSGRVFFHGNVPFTDVPFYKFQYLIFPTWSDSFAFVIQECTFHGVFAIMSSQAGCSEFFRLAHLDAQIVEQSDKQCDEDFYASQYYRRVLNAERKGLLNKFDTIFDFGSYSDAVFKNLVTQYACRK